MTTGPNAERRLEGVLSIVLRYGTWSACALIGAGIVWVLIEQAAPGPTTATTAASASGMPLVTLGVALLLGLPVLRVALMAIAFARERDYLFVALAAAVLAVIGLGLVLGSR
jgi:uncharacterized membrane protein